DGSLFGLFTIPLLQGDAETALQAPNSVVISASVARKYFGTVNCIGKAVELNNWYRQREYTVSGVFLDIPEHSHLKSSLFFSLSTLTQTHGVLSEWGWRDFYTYLLLREGTAEAFQDKIAAEDYLGKQYGRYRELGVRHELFLQPITDIHLTSRLNLEVEPNGNGRSVRYLLLIGLFILLMAWVNYINLTTARAVNRAKEVGIRKAVGAGRGSLLRQFMAESLFMNSLAFGLAAGLTATVQPWFYQLVGKVVPLQVLQRPELLGVTSVMFFLGMVLSSAYPAFVLSAYTPLDALKEKVKEAAGELSLRKALIVFQFTLSVLLAVATVVVYHQLEYMRSQDLGMNISQTLAVQAPTPHDSLALSRYRTFKNRLMQHPEVIGVTGSHLVPGDNYLWTVGIRRLQDGGNGVAHQTAFLNAVEPSFLPDYEMDILAGRNFHPEEGLDQDAMILSETACRQLGFPGYEKALGQQFALVGDTFNVIGVMSDYHQWGLQEATGAYVFIQRPDEFRRYAVKLSGGGTEQSVALVQEIYNDIFEDGVFEYFFLDRHFNEQYRADEQFGQS
ncbi:MAG: ABC transporter permease, partial [Phaeodactylibacter sp.]|nr:ABC transporter permease [Phaeodactylibacter sp.]